LGVENLWKGKRKKKLTVDGCGRDANYNQLTELSDGLFAGLTSLQVL
jgi:hypothetical protein